MKSHVLTYLCQNDAEATPTIVDHIARENLLYNFILLNFPVLHL